MVSVVHDSKRIVLVVPCEQRMVTWLQCTRYCHPNVLCAWVNSRVLAQSLRRANKYTRRVNNRIQLGLFIPDDAFVAFPTRGVILNRL